MRPTLTYLTERFSLYNAQCFGGTLPPIALRITHARSRLGVFAYVKQRPAECHIGISDAFDLPQQLVDDTIIHEMIHYYLHVNGLADPTPHGPNFRAMMQRINALHGRNITIRNRLDSETAATGARPRRNIICLTTWADGSRGITVCGPGSAARIARAFKRSASVREQQWFYSAAPWFSRYPLVRTPKAYPLPDDFPADLLTPLR